MVRRADAVRPAQATRGGEDLGPREEKCLTGIVRVVDYSE